MDAAAVPTDVHSLSQGEKPGEVSFMRITAVEVFLLCLQPVPAAPHLSVHLGSSICGKSQRWYIFRGAFGFVENPKDCTFSVVQQAQRRQLGQNKICDVPHLKFV